MANKTANQEKDIIKSVRMSFAGPVNNRSYSSLKDQRYINVFAETIPSSIDDSKLVYLVKRPGLSLKSTISPGTEGRGSFYYWGKEYTVFGDTLYKDGVSLQTLNTSTGNVGFCESTGTTKYLFFCDGIDGYTISTSGTITKINRTFSAWQASTYYNVDDIVIPTVPNGRYYLITVAGTSGAAEPVWTSVMPLKGDTYTSGCKYSNAGGTSFPTPHIPTPQYMDGYIFLPVPDDNIIYNCDLEDPESWTTNAYIEAIIFPDNVTGLGRQNNQLVAFGRMSIEFFYDAANTTGSPLNRSDHGVIQIGSLSPYAVFQNEKLCFFVGTSDSGGRSVWQIDGFTPKKISYEGIDKILDAEGTTINEASAFGVRTNGHFFYILQLKTLLRTLVYDVEEKMWHEWSTNSSGSHTQFNAVSAMDELEGRSVLQGKTDGKLYYLDPNVYKDDSIDIIVELTTIKIDMGTMARKFMYDIVLVCDQPDTDVKVYIRWTDDDYRTWSNWKQLDTYKRPYVQRGGAFRRRAYNIKFTDNEPIRFEGLDLNYSLGVS